MVSLVAVLSCSPKAITGSAEAKKIYMVGANILMIHFQAIQISYEINRKVKRQDTPNVRYFAQN
jgi:hypothetical protein